MANAPAATTPPPGPQIHARKPTGEIGYPLILLSGDEKAGKSLVPVVLSTSDRVGTVYWIDLGEGAADEYAALPGANYMVIEHDGSYRMILEQITAIWHEAARALREGEPPVVIVVDSMSAEWTMLVNWTNDRAKRSKHGQKVLRDDADAEIDPTSNLWNDANKRHKRVMDLLMTFPGIAIVTARGKDVMVMGPNGVPTTEKVRKPEGQKGLAYDADAWIWMSRAPRVSELMGVRSLRVMVPEGETLVLPTKKVGPWNVLDLETWIFDNLGANSGKKDDLPQLRGDEVEGVYDLIQTCPTEQDLQAIWNRVKDKVTPEQRAQVLEVVNYRLDQLRQHAAGEGSQEQPGETSGTAPPEGSEPTLDQHGPDSDAEKLRQAAEARQDADAAAAQEHADQQEVMV